MRFTPKIVQTKSMKAQRFEKSYVGPLTLQWELIICGCATHMRGPKRWEFKENDIEDFRGK